MCNDGSDIIASSLKEARHKGALLPLAEAEPESKLV